MQSAQIAGMPRPSKIILSSLIDFIMPFIIISGNESLCIWRRVGILKASVSWHIDYVSKSGANRLWIFILYCAAPKLSTPFRGIMSIHITVFMFSKTLLKNDEFLFICGSFCGFICLNYLDSVIRFFFLKYQEGQEGMFKVLCL